MACMAVGCRRPGLAAWFDSRRLGSRPEMDMLAGTDGSSRLYLMDPATLELRRAVEVHDEGRPVAWLNEVEWVKGEVWANVWQTDCVARIDPSDGHVRGWLVLGDVHERMRSETGGRAADVLNGATAARMLPWLLVTLHACGCDRVPLCALLPLLCRHRPHPRGRRVGHGEALAPHVPRGGGEGGVFAQRPDMGTQALHPHVAVWGTTKAGFVSKERISDSIGSTLYLRHFSQGCSSATLDVAPQFPHPLSYFACCDVLVSHSYSVSCQVFFTPFESHRLRVRIESRNWPPALCPWRWHGPDLRPPSACLPRSAQ